MSIKRLLSVQLLIVIIFVAFGYKPENKNEVLPQVTENPEADTANYWFLLHRKSNSEELYAGVPGNKEKSKLVKVFQVKAGIPGKKPTPLPTLIGREYWIITQKHEVKDNPEIAPYFLTLNIPTSDAPPFGPTPYLECNGQCDWEIPGAFGLHGIAGNEERISNENPGSSGCVRHKDEDITYLYNLLSPENSEIRYYIEDN